MSESQDEGSHGGKPKFNNSLPFWGNETSMNLNNLILTNIQSSTYFKVTLFKLKTYHEVIDEIYYQVKHMEPWEKGSRKTSGQTGMCGGVRGVGAGGIVSSAFCLLYKLYTLRLTRKQLNGLLTHCDSPYIRALGFIYIRYTQPPADLFGWFEEYLADEEEIDIKAGGGGVITIGQMLVQFLTKLDWCGTVFPRIPVPIQKQIQAKLEDYAREYGTTVTEMAGVEAGNSKQHGGRNRQNNYEDRGNDYGGQGKYRHNDQNGDAGSQDRNRERRENAYGKDRYGNKSSHRARYSRSRSRSPPRSKNYEYDRGSSSRRRSPSEERYGSTHSRRRDDYYDRDRDYKSSSHRRY